MALIQCKDAAFGYDDGIVVEGLNFTVIGGDYLCVVGENGAGKSTLIKGLLRLKKTQRGEILFSDDLPSTQIGYLPQQTVAQKDFPASAFEVVLSGRQNSRGARPFYTKEDRTAAFENMRLLSIESLQKKCYRELSGGQQQRVLLARALSATKKMMLLDEPVAGLDPVATNELYLAIESINKSGITVVMVSHDVKGAAAYAKHILHLNHHQEFWGGVNDYRNSEFGRRFLGEDADV